MTSIGTRFISSVLLVLLALAAVQPVIAQSAQLGRLPQLSERRPHQAIPAGKTCASCHTKIYAEWKAGPHGKNDVQCSVCHGDVTEKLTAKVSYSVCGQCHNEHALRPRS